MPAGWLCEGCGTSWAPHVDSCRRCSPENVSSPTSVPQAELTVGALWDQYSAWAEAHVSSWRTMKAHGVAHAKTFFVMEGERVNLHQLPWTKCTPAAAELYRTARVTTVSRLKKLVSPITVDRELSTLQSMFAWFKEVQRTIPYNPISGYRRVDPQEYVRKTALTQEDVKRFLSEAHPTFQDLYWTAYRCAGMRRDEVRLLRKSEVDWAARAINLSAKRNKNRRARVIPFPADVESILRRCCEVSRGDYVFVNPRDPSRKKPISQGTLWRWLDGARRRSKMSGFDGETLVFHTARHSGVTELVTSGAQESHVKRAAGMSDQIFARYSQFNRPQQDALRRVMDGQVEPVSNLAAVTGERREPKRAESDDSAKIARTKV